MSINDKGYWQTLCNALHLISKFYNDHKHIENNIVEIMDEIEGELDSGFHTQSIELYIENGRINIDTARELTQFYNYVINISPALWNTSDFDTHEEWQLARDWANTLLKKLGESKKGYDSSGDIIIYLKDD